MGQSKSKKKVFNMAYGIGASIVIIGALFKILHWRFANIMLMVGMGVEALVFLLSAFEPVEEDLDWTIVYPELAEGKNTNNNSSSSTETQGMLSEKLDELLKEAKLDANLIGSLGESIKSFEGATKELTSSSEMILNTNKYNEQISLATVELESLNSLYKLQANNIAKQNELNSEITELNSSLSENSIKLKKQMESLATNLSSLNDVYGGMLSAMSNT